MVLTQTREEILEKLDYDEINGKLIWKIKRGKTLPGQRAGTPGDTGRLQMSLFGRRIPVSHVVWFLSNGRWPRKNMVIDHIDRNPNNDRITNLREITQELNVLHAYHENSTQGVYETYRGRYCTVVEEYGLSICTGVYKTAKQAHRNLKTELYINARR